MDGLIDPDEVSDFSILVENEGTDVRDDGPYIDPDALVAVIHADRSDGTDHQATDEVIVDPDDFTQLSAAIANEVSGIQEIGDYLDPDDPTAAIPSYGTDNRVDQATDEVIDPDEFQGLATVTSNADAEIKDIGQFFYPSRDDEGDAVFHH